MQLDLIVRGGTVVRSEGTRPEDVGIVDGRIVELSPSITTPTHGEISAAGLYLFPGIMDAHVHFNEPGRTAWEGIASGSRSLAAGGGVSFFDMPLNSSPPTLDGQSFDLKRQACEANAVTDFALWGGLTPHNLDHLEELADRGVIGFKAFMCDSGIDDFAACDDDALAQGLRIAAERGLPVAVHAESQAITEALTAEARRRPLPDWTDYLGSRPIRAEIDAVERAIGLAAEAGARLHIVHISHPQVLHAARELANRIGCDLSCETCPHYLLLNEKDLSRIGAAAKCAPPLRSEEARRDMIAAAQQGLIETIGSDHSPAPAEMKQSSDPFEIWGGISGVQLTLRALLTVGFSPERIAGLTATNVARRFKLPGKGGLEIGADADLTLVDVRASAKLRSEELLDRHRFSPYIDRTFRGRIQATMVRGNVVYQNGTITASREAFRPRLLKKY